MNVLFSYFENKMRRAIVLFINLENGLHRPFHHLTLLLHSQPMQKKNETQRFLSDELNYDVNYLGFAKQNKFKKTTKKQSR